MDVKKRLRQLMDERGWTVYKLAKEADIPPSTVQNMFKRNTDPSIYTLECICKGMGMTLCQFFDEENERGLSSEQARLLQEWSRLEAGDRELILLLLEAMNRKGARAFESNAEYARSPEARWDSEEYRRTNNHDPVSVSDLETAQQ